jgi:hypothetical protein
VVVVTVSVNVRSKPAGVLIGTQPVGTTGKVTGGPVQALLGTQVVNWWIIAFPTGSSGWVGEDDLSKFVPTPTPTPRRHR